MNISQTHLQILRNKFLDQSPLILGMGERIKENSEKIRRLILEDSLSGYTEEALKVLSKLPDFYVDTTLHLGEWFRHQYYPEEENRQITYFLTISLKFPRGYTDPSSLYYNPLPNISQEALQKILPINNEIIQDREKIIEIKESFCRLIHPETSLVWLKDKLPGVYKHLKQLENS